MYDGEGACNTCSPYPTELKRFGDLLYLFGIYLWGGGVVIRIPVRITLFLTLYFLTCGHTNVCCPVYFFNMNIISSSNLPEWSSKTVSYFVCSFLIIAPLSKLTWKNHQVVKYPIYAFLMIIISVRAIKCKFLKIIRNNGCHQTFFPNERREHKIRFFFKEKYSFWVLLRKCIFSNSGSCGNYQKVLPFY